MRKIFAPLAVALLAMSTQASAGWRTFVAHGHVTIATPTAPSGAKVTIQFSYDADIGEPNLASHGDGKGSGYTTAAYGFATEVTMKVNGHVMTAPNVRIDILNNAGSNVEDAFSVYAYPMVMDGTTFPEGSIGFYLGSGPGNTKVLKSTALPRKIKVEEFDSPGFQYGFAQTDGSSNGGLLNIVIDSVEEIDSHKGGKH
ncbi:MULTISPECIES: hypothetical protein [unclassified Roseateles]|uniref:hypothetical protein n=1 Tax=unclassified Roseateles TaxID=2626991 RepID=UPI0006F92055|nr:MULTISPECIES: hypothetical protein [unclassified Roseateles]KQW43377.1 hypothetical protein ASC81_16495 [Pelomonas sp. Root405]KRA71115.1 hypothetical protein ASD88_15015 [Pelomonas sp. Root662]